MNTSDSSKTSSGGMLHPHTHVQAGMDSKPFVIERGQGVYVYDDQGKRYLEAAAGLWCASLGFGSERLAKAAYDAIKDLGYYHTFRNATSPHALALSEALLAIAPQGMSHVLLQCSGSEANDTAVKLVWYYWNAQNQPLKRKIISRRMSYHGSTAIGVCLTGKSEFHDGFGLPFPGFLYTDFPNYYRNHLENETEEEYATRLAEKLEAMILEEGPETIAAFWAEPVMGAGGAVLPPSSYFEKVQKVLRKYDILLVADEVICGFGRTGEMWGTQTFGLKPDMICCAKALSAGMQPISAVLLNDRILQGMTVQSDRTGRFVHGYTYAGHPATTAVALETLRIYEEMDLIGHVKAMEPVFLSVIGALTEHPLVGDFRGCGLIGGLEIVANKTTREMHPSDLKIAQRIDDHCRARGLILRFVGNRIAFSPPLIITADELRDMAAILKEALDATFADLN
jgi:4-aminobutyrate--pyruvate transaminase